MLNACKPLPGPLSKIFAPLLDGRLLRDGFASLVQTFSPTRLLGMLSASGETAYMIGSTAPSSFDSREYLVAPYNGTPRDFMRFKRDLNIRLAREYVPGGQPGDADYSLQETLEGTDEYGVVFQGTPEALTDPPHSAPERRAFKRHERRNRMLASYFISHILDENLKAMIQAAHPYDGYAAWNLLKANCYREPNDLTILEMNKIWADSDFSSVGIDENSIGNMIRLLNARLFHRVTGSTGSECPAPVPIPGTGRYRPVTMFVLAPHTDWPTCPGRLLICSASAKPRRERPAGRLAAF
jgi:hypothetical protein